MILVVFVHLKEHKVVNHSLHFVDPEDSSVHTNTIESTWRVLKRNVLPRTGTTKALYDSYFASYCIEKRYLKGARCQFKAFLELVKRVYPLNSAKTTPRKLATAKRKINEVSEAEGRSSNTGSIPGSTPSTTEPRSVSQVKRFQLMSPDTDDIDFC